MGDVGDMYRALKKERQQEGVANRDFALREFDLAKEAAEAIGVQLEQISDTQYQFQFESGALLNFYPGNGRLYWDRNRPRGRFLQMPAGCDGWTLMMVIQAIKENGK